MRVLERLTSKLGARRHRVIDAVAQGEHSTDPPLKDLQDEVEGWLNHHLSETKETYRFILQVERRRQDIGRGAFYGVKALYQPSFNPCSVELRARPKKNDYQWNCHLICESEEVAHLLISVVRPEACAYMVRHEYQASSKASAAKKGSTNLRERQGQKQDAEQKLLKRLSSMLRRRSALRALCATLEEVASTGVPVSTVYREIAAVLKQEDASSFILQALTSQLVDEGILDPIDMDAEEFLGTVLLEEYAAQHRTLQHREAKEELKREWDSLHGLHKAVEREKERLQARLKGLEEQGLSLVTRLEEVRAEYESF
ncbi:MAG TPA: hypothetical protein VLA04_05205 [Verrucomicrobiae bacterium]|nr:hypothetical protein [Verrucomicrobiae bacterium]